MKMKMVKALTMGLIMTALMPFSVFAGDDNVAEIYAGNAFYAGSEVEAKNVDAYDVFVAGNILNVNNASANGNMFVAGNILNLSQLDVETDMFMAGNNMNINDADIDGNVYVAGSSLTVNNTSAKGVFVAAGNITMNGEYDDVYISGDSVSFNGDVHGDLVIDASNIELGDDVTVDGKMTITSATEPALSDGISVGAYEYIERQEEDDDHKAAIEKAGILAKAFKKIATRLFWVPAMVIVALVLILVCGKSLDEANDILIHKPTGMVLAGVIGWMTIPVACLILAITVIGLPLAALVTMAYVFMLLLGLTFAGASLGRVAFPKLHPVLASVIGVAVLELVRIIPVIGGLVAVVADMYLIGYVLYTIYTRIASKKTAVAVVEEQ